MHTIVVCDGQFKSVMLPGFAVDNLHDSRSLRVDLGKALHDGSLNNCCAGILGLQYWDISSHVGFDPLSQVRGLAKPADKNDGLDVNLGSKSLVRNQLQGFQNNGVEDSENFGRGDVPTIPSDLQLLVVFEPGNREIVFLGRKIRDGETTLDLVKSAEWSSRLWFNFLTILSHL